MEDKDIFDGSFFEKDENEVKDNDVIYEYNGDESCQEFGGSDASYQSRKESKKEEILVNVIGTLAIIAFCAGLVFFSMNR